MVAKNHKLNWLWVSACWVSLMTGQALAVPQALPIGAWQDRDADRAALRALLDEFNARLQASTSATLTLESWCAEHHLATSPKIAARVQDVPAKPTSSEQRRRLKVGRDEVVRFRHVALVCGDVVLSQADIWYVPSRLTAEMNQQLDASDIPFGRVIRPLGPTRKTFSARILWPQPGDQNQRHSTATALSLPAHVIRHRALVLDGKGLPLAEVAENYTQAIIAVPDMAQNPASSAALSNPNEIDWLNQHR